jgi:hypothetical protein
MSANGRLRQVATPTDFSIPNDYDLNDSSSFVSKLAANIQDWFDEIQLITYTERRGINRYFVTRLLIKVCK